MWYEQYFNNPTNDVSRINASMNYTVEQKNDASVNMLTSSKINVSSPHSESLASSHRDEGVPLVVEINDFGKLFFLNT